LALTLTVLARRQNYDDDLVNGSVGKVVGFRTQKQHKAMIESGEYGEGVRFSSEETDSGSQKGKNMPNDRDETAYPVVEFHTSSGTRIIRLVRRDVFKIDGPDGEMKCQREQVRRALGAFIICALSTDVPVTHTTAPSYPCVRCPILPFPPGRR
jgi:hypothetical protein